MSQPADYTHGLGATHISPPRETFGLAEPTILIGVAGIGAFGGEGIIPTNFHYSITNSDGALVATFDQPLGTLSVDVSDSPLASHRYSLGHSPVALPAGCFTMSIWYTRTTPASTWYWMYGTEGDGQCVAAGGIRPHDLNFELQVAPNGE